ncbi:ABC transporter substrate-binding protein [Cryobacterium sp. TMS1-13-1]|uniref:ABC transporter substrate-binding protein n=1 Tax=Cryobacterium sp. TMS1-13-1 TaxID=1259220 RepID=UPI00106D4F1F|nr:ABC transporter substrate-binding protein [Cryobacterium sp. TMS1-13-1]TFD21279.1 peptide ABC transporter substrate-binding protein [Cryobacterium sp. TMS1-13-1]
MTSAFTNGKRALAATAGLAAAALVLAGCSAGGDTAASTGGPITIGTTDKVTMLDPAGSYDSGSFSVQTQVFPLLMNSDYGTADVEPDIAVSAEFTTPTEYTVVLKPDLEWANGNALTASDVKFSFDRQLAIVADNEPSALLANLDSTAAIDDTTVVFTLKAGNDQIFPQILSSPAGVIVDEDSFSATELTTDDDIVAANAFAGQYVLTSYDFNNLLSYKAYEGYQGLLGAAKTDVINVKYYTDASNLKLDVQEGNIDVAWRSLSATDIDDLRGNDAVKVVDGPGGEIRYITFNFNTQPFGATTAEADPVKALAVRVAVADLVDREEIASQVYKGSFTPLYSYVAAGLTGANESLKGLYGDGEGGPDAAKAAAGLEAAGITEPVELNLQYSNDHYGPSSGDEYAMVKDQLEASGLFTVNLQTTEWVQYSKDRTADVYPAYQLGWFPDYSDADNYLLPFFAEGNFLQNHYDDTEVTALIKKQGVTNDPDERTALIEEIQDKVAAQLSTVPLLQGAQVAITGTDITGAENTLDLSFKFRYGALAKG